MSPYRQVSRVAHRTRPARRHHPEELVAYALLVVVGAIPVLVVLLDHTRFGVAGTLGGLMMVLGLLGFARAR